MESTPQGGGPEGRRTRAGRRHPCPRCGSRDVAAIQYGYPVWDDVWERNTAEGEWAVGGCVLFEGQPDYRCNRCGAAFLRGGVLLDQGAERG